MQVIDQETVLEPVLFAKALADDTRQEIMKKLCCEWLNVGQVVESLGGSISQPTVSHHLRLLEEARLVDVRPEGRQRYYTLNEKNFTLCCGQLMADFAPTYASTATDPTS